MPPEALGVHKDLSEAWSTGGLQLDLTQEKVDRIMWEVASWPAERREVWEEKGAVLEYENKMARPGAERAAFEVLKGRLGA